MIKNQKERGTILIELSLIVIVAVFIALTMVEFAYAIRGYLIAQQLSRESASRILRECSDEYIIDKSRLDLSGSTCLDDIQNNLVTFINQAVLPEIGQTGTSPNNPGPFPVEVILSVYRAGPGGSFLTTEFVYSDTQTDINGNPLPPGLYPTNANCGDSGSYLSLVAPRAIACGISRVAVGNLRSEIADDLDLATSPRTTVIVAEVFYDPGFVINFFGPVFITDDNRGLYDITII